MDLEEGTKAVNRPCHACAERLNAATAAIRRHAGQMSQASDLARKYDFTEPVRQEFKARLVESLYEAQAAWDAYRDHLIEHALLPSK
jgi:hypothetical protein